MDRADGVTLRADFPLDLVSQLYLAAVSSASCQHHTALGKQCLGCRGASCGVSAVFSAGGFCLGNKLPHKQLRDDGKPSSSRSFGLAGCAADVPTLEQTPAALFPVLELPELVTGIVLWESSGHSRAITVTGQRNPAGPGPSNLFIPASLGDTSQTQSRIPLLT